MADPVKHDHADDDRGGGTIRPGVLYVPAYDDVSNATGAEAGDLVYATGNGTSTEGMYRYDGSSYTRLSGSDTLTDSGTDTDGGDNYQLPQAADNLDLQNDGAIQNAESVETNNATINGYPAGQGIAQGDSVNFRSGDRVSVSQNTWHTAFNLGSAVDVIDGAIYGGFLNTLRVTWSDGTTDTFGNGTGNDFVAGEDDAGNAITVMKVPKFQQIKKLEFYNRNTSAEVYGWSIWTT